MPAHAMTHLTDADLVRHLDAEGDPRERSRRYAHLGACAECERRARALGHQSSAITDWLARTDTAPTSERDLGRLQDALHTVQHAAGRGRRGRRITASTTWLRAAAIVLLVAAPLAAFPSVREWVATRVGLGSSEPAPAAGTPESTAAAEGPVIRFVPTPGALSVRLDEERSGGTLSIVRAAGPEAVLEGAGGAGAPPPIVSEDGIRIPAAGTPSDYRLRVPDVTTTVVVILPGGTVRVTGAAIDGGQVIDLSGP